MLLPRLLWTPSCPHEPFRRKTRLGLSAPKPHVRNQEGCAAWQSAQLCAPHPALSGGKLTNRGVIEDFLLRHKKTAFLSLVPLLRPATCPRNSLVHQGTRRKSGGSAVTRRGVECHTPTAPRSWRDRSLASLPSSQRAARADRRAERGDGPSVDPSGGRVKSLSTDPELKGRWLIPRRQKGDFWACWDERDEAAFGGVCRWPLVVFGSTGLKKIHFPPLARLGWFFCR